MYLLEPDRGRRRRKLLSDQIMHLVSQSDDVINTTARDLRNRARGMLAETRARFDHTGAIDEVLAARVRSRMGWVVSHPHAIAVSADQGRVTLSGPILAHEVDDLQPTFHINGADPAIVPELRRTLLDVLRNDLQLTGMNKV
jgi:ElaB/YqjD/DUF883 family membrane-anchored ribosome-binding protein